MPHNLNNIQRDIQEPWEMMHQDLITAGLIWLKSILQNNSDSFLSYSQGFGKYVQN